MKKIEVLDYKIEIIKDDDGDYIAKMPKLGCIADGKTIDEAINELKEIAEDFLKLAEVDGKPIPVPEKYEEEIHYSGKFTLRMPKSLHKMVAKQAEKEECSINQLIVMYISMGLGNKFGKNQVSIISFDGFFESLIKEKWSNNSIQNDEGLFLDIRDVCSRL
jgi:antitoxin HicB